MSDGNTEHSALLLNRRANKKTRRMRQRTLAQTATHSVRNRFRNQAAILDSKTGQRKTSDLLQCNGRVDWI